MLFLCEGWPLCLHDQVVIHIAPINPLLLQPGDFYLQVAPFCEQSARILVCSLLKEEGLPVELVEETPIPETSYPCIFSRDWLEEINQGRSGTPLSQCLLATEQGVVRLPWERVFMPEFVDVPTCAGSSMASAPPSCPPLPPPLPSPTHFPEKTNCSFPPPPSEEAAPKQYPVTIKNSILTSSSHPSAFSVETRICPAKHGIAVSLCLVDTRAAASSRLVKVKDTETEPKPVGLVSPSKWDSCFTGSDLAIKTSTVPGTCSSAVGEAHVCKGEDKSAVSTVSDHIEEDKQRNTNSKDTDRGGSIDHIAAEGEYIDILQATMLFGRAQSMQEEQQKLEMQMKPQAQMEPPGRQRPGQMQPHAHMEAHRQRQWQPDARTPAHKQPHVLPTKPQMQSPSRSQDAASLRTGVPTELRPSPTLHHSQSQPDTLATSQCVRTIRFSEKPCTPCMRRRQGEKVSRAQELRCRYRDSYQAAIQNPVAFGRETERRDMLALVEEDGDFSQCEELPETETGCNVQGVWSDPKMHHLSSVSAVICKESGEKNTVPCWKPGDTNIAPCMDYRATNVFNVTGVTEQTTEKRSLSFGQPKDAKTSDNFHSMNGAYSAAGLRLNTNPQQSHVLSAKHQRIPFSSGEISAMNVTPKPCERLQSGANLSGASPDFSKARSAPQSRRDSGSDGRCSSLSTAVVDTSERCELVLFEGQNVRRKENHCAEVPQLHVVKCKNSTAFRLVSPKINRRVIPGTQRCSCYMSC